MSLREILILGSASQVPTRQRNHNGYLLRWDGSGFLFDPGEGTQRQLTMAGVAASSITAILITHFHGDHSLGLASMAQRLSLDGVPHPVEVFFPESGLVYYERLVGASIYHRKAELVPRPLPLDGADRPLPGGLLLEARPLHHLVDTLGYRVAEPDGWSFVPERLEALGIRGPAVGDLERRGEVEADGRVVRRAEVSRPRPGASFAFVMDTRPCPGALELMRGASLVLAEATFLEAEAELAHEYGHMTAAEAARLARDAGAKRLLLSHFSQRYREVEAFLEEARPIFAAVEVARDLERHPFPRPAPAT